MNHHLCPCFQASSLCFQLQSFQAVLFSHSNPYLLQFQTIAASSVLYIPVFHFFPFSSSVSLSKRVTSTEALCLWTLNSKIPDLYVLFPLPLWAHNIILYYILYGHAKIGREIYHLNPNHFIISLFFFLPVLMHSVASPKLTPNPWIQFNMRKCGFKLETV